MYGCIMNKVVTFIYSDIIHHLFNRIVLIMIEKNFHLYFNLVFYFMEIELNVKMTMETFCCRHYIKKKISQYQLKYIFTSII